MTETETIGVPFNRISRYLVSLAEDARAHFLGEVIMGKEYPRLYQEEPEDDDWFDFLCQQGWA